MRWQYLSWRSISSKPQSQQKLYVTAFYQQAGETGMYMSARSFIFLHRCKRMRKSLCTWREILAFGQLIYRSKKQEYYCIQLRQGWNLNKETNRHSIFRRSIANGVVLSSLNTREDERVDVYLLSDRPRADHALMHSERGNPLEAVKCRIHQRCANAKDPFNGKLANWSAKCPIKHCDINQFQSNSRALKNILIDE